MVLIATIILAVISGLFVVTAAKKREAQYFVIGFLGLFALGHYVLPLIFRPLSHLRSVSDESLFVVISMVTVFFGSLGLGFLSSVHLAKEPTSFRRKRSGLDVLLFRRPVVTFSVLAAIYFTYIANSIQTSYQAESIEAYIAEAGRFSSVLSSLGDIALAGMAIFIAYVATNRKRKTFVLLLVIYAGSLPVLLSTAQRSAAIEPIVLLAVSFGLFGKSRAAKFTVLSAIALLIVASPFLVLMRGTNGLSGLEALTGVNWGDGAQMVFLISILDRADGLLNMIALKEYIDINGFANTQYFYSILTSYVPGIVFTDKPTAMSITGGIDGHLSVIAWSLIKDFNNLGSLTVFGPITAYHEGGWPWIAINGFLTGSIYNFFYRFLCRRSDWLKIIYVMTFPMLCLKNVPPSAFQIFTSFSATFYIMTFLWIISMILRSYVRPAKNLKYPD